MKREEFISWAESRGWTMDRFGHLQRFGPLQVFRVGQTESGDTSLKAYRFKVSRIAVRYEVKCNSGWLRLRSAYFSKLSITPDGKLEGLVR